MTPLGTSLETSTETSGDSSRDTSSGTAAAEEHGNHKDQTYLEECYALALRSAADYALDFDPPATQEFQRHVRALEERVSAESTPEGLRSLQASFRGELREFREKGRVYMGRLRDDLEGTAEAMQTFASSFAANGQDVQQRVRGEMSDLVKVADIGDLDKIRKSVRAATKEVARSYEEFNKANALVVAQLQHEIRLLHREMETERRVAWTDAASGAWTKRKIDDRLDELMKTPEAFCVIVILVTNLKRLETQCGTKLVNTALQALIKRFYGILGKDSLVARLSGDQFGAVLEVDSSAAQIIAREVGERLSSRYAVENNGITQNIELRVTCGIVGHAREGDSSEFRRKLQQMTGLVEPAGPATPK
jgi:GGDEF domain-containing protein